MTGITLYKHICNKYPSISYNGEDLNLDNLYANEIKKRWVNLERYPTINDIVYELKISERQIYRLAKANGLGSRWKQRRK